MKEKHGHSANPHQTSIKSEGQLPLTFSTILRSICRFDIIILFLVLFLVYNTVTGVGFISGDVAPASILPIALITNQNVYLDFATAFISSPDYSYAFTFVHGHYVSIFPVVTPILVTPLYAISYILCNVFTVPFGDKDFFILAKSSAAFVAALAGVFVYLSGKELFSKRIAILTTFVFAFATSTWSISSQALWQHGTAELLLAASIYLIIRNEKKESRIHILVLGILSGLVIFNRPPDSILLLPILVYTIWYQRKKLQFYLFGGLMGALPFICYNYSLFGNIFGGYAENLSLFVLNTNFSVHFIGLLVSPNAGLFIFCPVLILSIFGFYLIWKEPASCKKTLLLIAGLAVVFEIILYSFYTYWAASVFCFGPRYLTDLIPILCLSIGYFLEEWFGKGASRHLGLKKWVVSIIVCGLVVSSVCIQFVGAFYYSWSSNENQAMNDDRVWNLSDSIIVNSYIAGSQAVPGVFVYTLPPLPPLLEYSFPQKT